MFHIFVLPNLIGDQRRVECSLFSFTLTGHFFFKFNTLDWVPNNVANTEDGGMQFVTLARFFFFR